MTNESVIEQIKKGIINPVYLFFGAETFLINEMLEKLSQYLVPEETGDFNYDKLDGSVISPIQVVASASTLPIFAEKRLVVVKNAPWFSSTKGQEDVKDNSLEQLVSYLVNPASSTCLVMVAGEKIDARKKIVKTIQKVGQVIEFSPLRGAELNRWIEREVGKRGKKIEKSAVEYLSAAVGSNLAMLQHEIEKVSAFLDDKTNITFGDVTQTVSQNGNLSIFDLIDAIAKRQSFSAILKLREISRIGESEIKILSMLAKQVRLLLQIQSLVAKGYSENQIISRLGIHPFVVKKGIQQSRNFSAPELISSLELLLETDISIKTGKGNPLGLLETVILTMCSGLGK